MSIAPGFLPPQENSRATSTNQRVDRTSATKTVDSSSIPGRVKRKALEIDIHSFPV